MHYVDRSRATKLHAKASDQKKSVFPAQVVENLGDVARMVFHFPKRCHCGHQLYPVHGRSVDDQRLHFLKNRLSLRTLDTLDCGEDTFVLHRDLFLAGIYISKRAYRTTSPLEILSFC